MAQTNTHPTDASQASPASVISAGWIVPKWTDPRLPFAAILTTYALLGTFFLGFNRNPLQMLMTVAAGCLLEMLLARIVRGEKLVPLSAYISCSSIALLLNYSHNYWALFLPVFLTIASKYVLTFKGRHVFNPSMFGVATSLLLANEVITAAPAYQWGGNAWGMTLFILMAAISLFAFRIRRTALIVSFLAFYALQTGLRAWIMRHHLPPQLLVVGTLSAPSFFIFTFYMLTDPQTSPKTPKGQIAFAFVLTLVDLVLHKFESVFTFFYAALIMASGKFLFLHAREIWRQGLVTRLRLLAAPERLRALGSVAGLAGLMAAAYTLVISPRVAAQAPAFRFETIPPAHSGIHTGMGNAFNEVDPRLRHIAKWLLSVGDAVAVGDYDGDGKLDLFLTNPLKRPGDRLTLYRNLGDFRFQPVEIPGLAAYRLDPKQYGLGSAAAFADYDGDGDQDLFISFSFGPSRLFRNDLTETGKPGFTEITRQAGIEEHTVSITANFLDFDRDGKLDLLVGNTLHPYLPGYEQPTKLNIFDLPKAAYPGDRRMFNFMHNGWHNADNGGVNVLFRNKGDGTFERLDSQALGMPETHWTLAIGTGDLNHDGWTDLYCASDFGRDDLYLNKQGKGFERIVGRFFGDVGLDTYKGMNATLADFDRNGYLDVYVSNVHHALQAEGSLLWMTRPSADPFHPSFTDEATQRGALNEHRFGWGADAGDLDNDGWPDIVQANGMVDDRLDHLYEDHKDYWYVNHKLMQSGPEMHTYADMWGDIRGREIYPNELRRVYLNQGAVDRNQFVDVADLVGLTEGDNSRGVALADLDNDGDLDAVITNQHGPVTLLRNTLYGGTPAAAQPGWIGFTLQGDGKTTSRLPVGTKVEVTYVEGGKPVTQMQEVHVVNGFMAQTDPRLHFGLGQHRGPVDVRVTWYGDGRVQEFKAMQSGSYHHLVKGRQ